jgi:hypothetical protein
MLETKISFGPSGRQALSNSIKFSLTASRSQPPGHNSTAAAAVDICGSAVPSQLPAQIERLGVHVCMALVFYFRVENF